MDSVSNDGGVRLGKSQAQIQMLVHSFTQQTDRDALHVSEC